MSRRPGVSATILRGILSPLCRTEAIDMCGVVRLPRRLPHETAWLEWVERGRHGGLPYLARDPRDRADPCRTHSWASTLLVFAQRYTNGWTSADPIPREGCRDSRPWIDGVSRYARGRDYHDVLRASIRRIVSLLREDLHGRGVLAAESDLRSVDAVDAGPFLEREYAWLAGFGFFGKNTMLIHPRLGSGFFLGVALLSLEVTGLTEAPRPLIGPATRPTPGADGLQSLCGKCTSCLDACPTAALDREFDLDAGRCLSTWSIEWRGGAPAASRKDQGGLLFGCDICQAVCPWNHKAARWLTTPALAEYGRHEHYDQLQLGDLITMDDEAFRAWFRKAPLWRAHPAGMRRNALIVAANSGRTDLQDRIRRAADSDPDPGVREVAVWALRELNGGVS